MLPSTPLSRIQSILLSEPQGWLPACVEGERGFLCPDGWSLTWRGVVVWDLAAGRNVLLPSWRYHGTPKDGRRAK